MTQNVFDILQERGFIAQSTDEEAIRRQLGDQELIFYIGYDSTAASLHAGNLVTIMAMMHMQRAGHRPIGLIGGGTTMVGDPSGKTEMRRLLLGVAPVVESVGSTIVEETSGLRVMVP